MKKAREITMRWNEELPCRGWQLISWTNGKPEENGVFVRFSEIFPSPKTPEEIERVVKTACEDMVDQYKPGAPVSVENVFLEACEFSGPLFAAHERKRILGVVMGVLKSDELKYENELNGMTGTPRLWACRLESKLREMGEWNE